MAKIKKEDIDKIANLPDQVKADLAGLLGEVDQKDQEITTLRKANSDADAIVKNAPLLEAAVKERDAKISELTGELAKYTGKKKDEVAPLLSAFAVFFSANS